MNISEQYKDTAKTLRKVASDLTLLKEKRKQETREKCAAILVARVGLNELSKNLTKLRR